MTPTTRRIFGHIPNVEVGTLFPDRDALATAGVHRPLVAGISGSQTEGADSIVASGGYEDDEDYGDVLIYTGHGGNDPSTGSQIADQVLERGNLALAVSCREGLPVRVTRGANLASPFAPQTDYRYDGLYVVERYWRERGRSGFLIWRYRLTRYDARIRCAGKRLSSGSFEAPKWCTGSANSTTTAVKFAGGSWKHRADLTQKGHIFGL
jgi:putative restriction endonuclease